ncbi:hypothetical protein LTR62_002792 [Meristemomyces frigidus]|uniref:VASt domain-containing protein n=1 Tax=Meristemomyces frigidus TaxID=1508187 RepID=A0AAN7YJP7_9PEZI|nr:hypothetical protein LTR62_002792 [Meristemomyces frigidus]
MPSTSPPHPSPLGALGKLRRNNKTNDSNGSLHGSSGDNEEAPENASRTLRGSFDKGKERLRKSIDDRRNSGDGTSKSLSKLLARRKRSPDKDSASPGRALSAISFNSYEESLTISGNHSNASFDDSGHSSLLTDDNPDHEGKPIRPTLSPHQSHAGLLTLSSPEFAKRSQSVISITSASSNDKDQTLESTTSIPQIVEPAETEPFPQITPPDRSISPGSKLKDAFKLSRKQPAGDDDSAKSVNSGGGLGGLFRPKSRRSSVSSQAPLQPAQLEALVTTPDADIPTRDPAESLPQGNQLKLDKAVERPETPSQQSRGRSRINTDALPATPPNLVDTPTTLVTPPTPTLPTYGPSDFPGQQKSFTSDPQNASPPAKPLSSIESIRHRRAQSAKLPSKLSNAIPAPLTPTVEEAKTPGGTLTQPTSAAGFFSSFISAASKAADQLSQNIAVQQKGRPQSPSTTQELGEQISSETGSKRDTSGPGSRAVQTIGTGDLSLEHFDTQSQQTSMPSAVDLSAQDSTKQNGTTTQKAEEDAANRAVSAAYEKPLQQVISQAHGRPISIASNDRLTLGGDQSPPRSGPDSDALKRSGSVRSKISGKTRRHRASSATTGTGNTIAAALQASHSALANPSMSSLNGGHRMTGFAIASSKRNKDFHQLFRSVPEDDYLIEDYSAALQRDILLHGRLYVSEGHVCFSSNILGWVTNLVIGFDEVVSVEKKSTAVIFPNAIVIQTLQARNTFASLVARDSTYELIIGIWKISHPNLKSSLNGVVVNDSGTGDKTEVADPEGSGEETADGSDDEVYDEDEDDDDIGSFTDGGLAPSIAPSEVGDVPLSRKTSSLPLNGAPTTNGVSAKSAEGAEAAVAAASISADFPGPPTHAPTECTETAEHYDKPLVDTTIPAPLGKVYTLLFGPASGAFMRKWLIDDQKSRELQLTDDKIGLDNEHKTMTFDYIKPLYAPVGPKQTKCITTCNVVGFDLEKAVSIDCGTQTPDVPSGNVFTTRTRYCLMWGPGNSTRMIANCTVEWTGKSWLKSVIDKGALDGQQDYIKSLVAAVKAQVTTRPAAIKTVGKKGARRVKKGTDAGANVERVAVIAAAEQKAADWGIFEPLHLLLEPIIAIVRPFITSQTIIAVLFVLLVYTWLSPPGHRSGTGVGPSGYRSPERLVAYDELWRREESDLWDWLEDRVGLDHLYSPALAEQQRGRQMSAARQGMGRKLENERMSERQMDDAIRVTEERLAALKGAVGRKKERRKSV